MTNTGESSGSIGQDFQNHRHHHNYCGCYCRGCYCGRVSVSHYDEQREREIDLNQRTEGMKLNNNKRFLLRTITLTNCTIGKMYLETPSCTTEFLSQGGVDRQFLFTTMECPWLGNTPYISCIPAGDYYMRPWISPKHGACYYLESVDQSGDDAVGLHHGSRTECLWHVANKASELKGCIAGGQYNGVLDDEAAVLSSGTTMKAFYAMLDGFDYRLRIERF